MKAFKAKYDHGHFIDIETNKRLVPVQGAEYIITAKDKDFNSEDLTKYVKDIMDSEQKADWVQWKYGQDKYLLILQAGDKLTFKIGLARNAEGVRDSYYIFVCTLLEDLYLYCKKGKDGMNITDWRLADCVCVLSECIEGNLFLSENVPAQSLNSLYSMTVQFYLSMLRSGSVNVMTSFIVYEASSQYAKKSLDEIRNDVVRNHWTKLLKQ